MNNKIEYFEFSWKTIHRCSIDIEDENYISHTDDDVTFITSYIDEHWETRRHNVTRTRHFNHIRNELIASHKKNIAESQKEIDILNRYDTFDKYKENVYNKASYKNQ